MSISIQTGTAQLRWYYSRNGAAFAVKQADSLGSFISAGSLQRQIAEYVNLLHTDTFEMVPLCVVMSINVDSVDPSQDLGDVYQR